MSIETVANEPFDGPALAGWLTAETGVEGPFEVKLLSGGRSNLTFVVASDNGDSWILRRPPTGTLQASAHDVLREFRILAAMHAAGVRVPKPLAAGEDPAVSDAPFFLMERIEGEVLGDPQAAAAVAAADRRHFADELIDALADLHKLDIDAVGLDELRRPAGLIERQLRRWSRQLDGYESLASELLRPVQAGLEGRVPPPQRTSVVHGDYKLTNLVVGPAGELRAIFDWELTAIGDPLIDLGWLIASWPEPGSDDTWIIPPATLAPGFPAHAELRERYAARAGLDLTDLDYYLAFAYWRWSCINQGIIARFEAGKMGSKTIDLDAVRGQIDWQLRAAASLLGVGA